MLLLHKISKYDLKYKNDIIDCLFHNTSNTLISKILIISDIDDLETILRIDPKSKKLSLLKVDFNHFDMIKYSKKNTNDYVIYSTPFIKFNNDLLNIKDSLKTFRDIIRNEYFYYIFHKSVIVKESNTINNILVGNKIDYKLSISKLGYYKVFNINLKSIGWEISETSDSKILSKKVVEKETVLNIDKEEITNTLPKVLRNSKLDIVIVSVNYNDFLILTLSKNRLLFDNITVVTSPDDLMCKKICDKYGVNCVITNRMYEDGAIFNKGKAINEGIKSIVDPDYILLIDADIIIEKEIDLNLLDEDTFYSMDRIILPDYVSYLKYEESGYLDGIRRDDENGYGYFQLFNYKEKQSYPEISNDAAWSDLIFRDKFIKRKKLDGCVKHLGLDGRNWKGRVTDRFLTDDEFTNLYMKKSTYKICSYDDYDDKRVLKRSIREQKEETKLAILTTFFNPQNYINLRYNFNVFSKHMPKKDLFVVELSYDGNFYLDGDNIIRINGSEQNILWQKERLLNILLENIPTEYTNIAWVDCDLIFSNKNWIQECNEKLKDYKVVQLYEKANRLDANSNVGMVSKGIIKRIDEINKIDLNFSKGIPGFGWAIRREIIDEIKFLDTQIIGGADSLMCYSFLGNKDGFVSKRMNYEWFSCYSEWFDKAFKLVDMSVSYISGEITHLYHGKTKKRNYNDRYEMLSKYGFNPKTDLEKDVNGLWVLKNKEMTNELKYYFDSRDEDDNIININSYFDNIYVLNLDRRLDRWEKIEKKLNDIGIKYERFSAIDGNSLIIDNDFSNFRPGTGMIENKYAYACLLSHIEIIKDAKEKGYKKILIFEDDVLISKDIKIHLQKLRKIKDWKLLYLGASQYNWNLKQIDDFYHANDTLGCFAYAIDSSIYEEIIEINEHRLSIDNLLKSIQNKYQNECFVFYPNICIADVSESTIRDGRDQEQHSIKMKWDLIIK